MDKERRKILIALIVTITVGIAVYLRLWTIDYGFTSNETEILRRQFEAANSEAMDESAEWRLKYDEEADRLAKCEKGLTEAKQKVEDGASIQSQLSELQKVNIALYEKIDALKKELTLLKANCKG